MKLKIDKLNVEVYDTRVEMGTQSGKDIVKKINELLEIKDEVNIIFAAAPSQSDALKYLREAKDVDWTKVNALHMDEYHTLDNNHSAKFGNFLEREVFGHIPLKNVYYLKEGNETTEEVIDKYNRLLKEKKVDIVICGVGENGHIAFNDPHVADFNDPLAIKEIELDEACRIQQVNDGCFATLDEVPKTAITLTVPTLFNVETVFCIVPGKLKHNAIEGMLNGEVSEKLPASILRTHDNATLYLDLESYKG